MAARYSFRFLNAMPSVHRFCIPHSVTRLNISSSISTTNATRYQGKRLATTYRRFNNAPTVGRGTTTVAMVIAAGGGVFYVANLEKVPETGRRRFICVGDDYMLSMAADGEKEIRQQLGKQILPANHPTAQYVQKVASRVLKATFEHPTYQNGIRARNLDWKIVVVDAPKTANAFVLPNGFVCVFTGILPIAHDEDGLATILGHEISHQILKHSAERVSGSLVSYFLSLLIYYTFNISTHDSLLVNRLLLDLPNSRAQEAEADRVGLRLMARACFDPTRAPAVWERFEVFNKKQGSVPELLSTHPADEKRMKKMREWLPEAEDERASHCGSAQSFWNTVSPTNAPV